MMRQTAYSLLLLLLSLVPVASIAQHGKITILIEPAFNGRPLVPGDTQYVNGNGDTLTVDLLKFYITNVELISAHGTFADRVPHLIDAEQPASCKFDIGNIDAANYVALQFTLGVDSIANTSGANGGDLDPAKGMYWAWNSGYVMAKLEGRSARCKTLHHAFEFHIGGYMPPYNAARAVRLKLPAALIVQENAQATIHITADVAAWFEGVSLAKINSIMIPGKEACDMADRYAKMFAVTSVK